MDIHVPLDINYYNIIYVGTTDFNENQIMGYKAILIQSVKARICKNVVNTDTCWKSNSNWILALMVGHFKCRWR